MGLAPGGVLLLGACLSAALARAGDPVMWKVSADGRAPVYLFGTIHVGVSMDELDPAVREAFDASSKLVTESYDGPQRPVEELLQPEGRRRRRG